MADLSTVKITQLVQKAIEITDLTMFGDPATGILYKNTIQSLGSVINSLGVSGYQGLLAIADTPSQDGFYIASEAGTYINAGGLVVNLTNTFTIINVSGSQTVFEMLPIPLTITVNGIVENGNIDAVSGGEVFEYTSNKVFLNRYLKPNDLKGNRAYSVYDDVDVLEFSQSVNANEIEKNTISLPSDFAIPFDRSVKINNTITLTVNSKLGIRYKTPFKQNIFVSYWNEVFPSDNKNGGLVIRYIKGLNDTATDSVTALTLLTAGNVNSIIATIDGGGVFENITADRILQIKNYYLYNGRYFFNFAVEVTKTISETDFIAIDFGNDSFHLAGTANVSYEMFGFQVTEGSFLNQNDGEPKTLSIGEQGVKSYLDDNTLKSSHSYDNKIKDFFNGSNGIRKPNGSTTVSHGGIFTLSTNFSISNRFKSNKFNDAFTIEYNSGANIPKYVSNGEKNSFFNFFLETYATTEEENNATIGFWIDRRELNGNGLLYSPNSGGTWVLKESDLIAEGFTESRVASGSPVLPVWEVVKVDGDFTFLKFNLFNTTEFNVSIFNESANNVTSVTFYNPTLIYNKVIDPYFNYKSLAEKNQSQWIGKKFVWIGDSQYNDFISLIDTANNFGCTIIDAHFGGHSMKIRSSQRNVANYNSFYHLNLRNAVLDITDVDVYVMTASTNDGAGGGSLSTAAVQYVKDNYPWYGDDATTVNAKQALFDALSNADVDTNFDYKNCYSAYLKQIQENYPNAKIVVCSVPVSCTGYLTGATDVDGKGIWTGANTPDIVYDALNASRQQIALHSKEVSEKHNTVYADLLNEVGLSYWNFTRFSVDGTHWTYDIKHRIASVLKEEINKMNPVINNNVFV